MQSENNDSDLKSRVPAQVVASLQIRSQRLSMIGAIKAYGDAPAPIPADAVHRLVDLENRLYPVVQADKKWFFEMAGEAEAVQFARDLHVLHGVAAKTLEGLVERRGEWTKGDDDPLLHRLVALALYHHGAAVKWCFIRQEQVKPTLWPELHGLYKFAETQGIAGAPIVLFDGESQFKVTPLSLYMRALMLEVLNTGSLSMQQIEIAEGWLAEWTPEYALDETYSPRSHALYVDLDLMAGLQLVTGKAPKPSYRYARIEGLKEQVEAVRTQLRTGNPYRGRGSANNFSMEEHVALLATIERLYNTLLQASASRIEARKPVENLMADVRLGFADARAAVSAQKDKRTVTTGALAETAPEGTMLELDSPGQGSLELTLEPIAPGNEPTSPETPTDTPSTDSPAPAADPRWTRWRIHDMSSKGIGLIVDRVTGERISVGQLLAVKPDGFAYYLLGAIVRKLTQRTVGETLLGVEILSYRPLAVTLYRYSHARDPLPDPDSPPVPAMYLPGRNQEGKSDILVLPSGDVGLKNVFSLPTKFVDFRVRINRVLRKGGDWVGLRFEVIGKK